MQLSSQPPCSTPQGPLGGWVGWTPVGVELARPPARPPPGARPPAGRPISGFCIRDLPHRGHVFTPKIRFPGFVFGVCPIGAMYSPRLAGWPAGISGRNFDFLFFFRNGLKWPPRALGGPGAVFLLFSAYFWAPQGPLRGPWGGPGPPLFLPIFLKAAALWGAPPVQITLIL